MSIKNNKKYKRLEDPSELMENPSFIGTIVGLTNSGKIKLKTLPSLGIDHIVWIRSDDIISEHELEDGVIKIDVKKGSDILLETLNEMKAGSPSTSAPEDTTRVPKKMGYKPVFETANGHSGSSGGGGSSSSGCGNCDWIYMTHCTSCTDRSSAQTCLRPFIPYGSSPGSR